MFRTLPLMILTIRLLALDAGSPLINRLTLLVALISVDMWDNLITLAG